MLTMVFTDLVNSTPVKASLPGAGLAERNRTYLDTILTPHRARVEACRDRVCPDRARGRTVDQLGDAFFLVFSSVSDAARFSVALMKSHADDPIPTPLGPVRVRIGMHTGEPLDDPEAPGHLVGQEVDYAARLSALAEGGQVVISEATAALLRQAMLAEARSHPHGKRELKGIGPVPVFELLYDGKEPQPLRDAALAPENLPPPPARVTGRGSLLGEVRQRLHEGGVVVLTGEGGMGKTTLALAVAHDVLKAGEAVGGVAWVNCETGPDLAECVRQAAAVYFGDRCEGEPAGELGKRVVAHLADRRAVLVLDNFETVAGDAGLIRWLAGVRAPARVLVTTRETRAGLAGQVVPVHELLRADAVELFLSRSKAGGLKAPPPAAVVDAMCAAVGDQPLAVELLAARAVRLPAERLLEQLRKKGLAVLDGRPDPTRPDRHQSARACVEASVGELPPAARDLLFALSVLPAGFDSAVVVAVTGGNEWDDAADELVDSSIWRNTGEQFSVHPLVRQFAAEGLGAARAAAEARAAGGVIGVAVTKSEGLCPGPDHLCRAKEYFGWMSAQLPNLVVAAGWAREQGLWALLPALARATEFFWNIHGHWPVAERLGHGVLEAAERLSCAADEAYGHDFLGFVYRHQGRDEEAIAAHHRALVVYAAHPDAGPPWRTHARLGKVYSINAKYPEAEDHLGQALAGCRAAGDRRGEVVALSYCGQNAKYLGEWDRAAGTFEDALALASRLGETHVQREILYHLGDLRLQTGDLPAAERNLRESIALAREFANREAEAKALSDLGVVALRRGRTDEAREHLKAALAVHQQTGFRNRAGRALRRLAEVEYAAGNSDAAIGYARQAVNALVGTQAVETRRRAGMVLAALEEGRNPYLGPNTARRP